APPEGRDREDLSVFRCPTASVVESGGRVDVTTARVTLSITLDPPALAWSLPTGEHLLADHPELAYRFAATDRARQTSGSTAAAVVAPERGVRHTLTRDLAEMYLGLGEVSGELDKHHRRYRLSPKDALGYDAQYSDPLYKHLPVYTTLTPGGHAVGLLYDVNAAAVFDFGSEVDNYVGKYRYAEFAARELDYYVMVGPELPTVVRLIQDLTGYAPVPPDWTLGYLGSTMAYTDAEDPTAALSGFVAKLSEHDIPCTAFHLSSGYSMGDDGNRYVFSWNRRRVPEPPAMVEPLKAAGIRTLANIKPALLTTHPAYAHLAAAGGFVREAHSDQPYTNTFWGGLGSYVDFTNPVGYAWWKQQVITQILENGIDATWNDNNEFQIDDDDARTAAGPAGDLRPVLTLLMNRASRDAQVEFAARVADVQDGADGHWPRFQLTRSGSLGVQRYAQTWSGDNQTSWKTLQYNIPMGLGLALSGWSNHGHDVGGFAGPPPGPELLVRWIEAGVLMPRFSIHSWNDDATATEPWTHPEVLDKVRRLVEFRTALVPYLRELMHEASTTGTPVTRPFVYQFPEWRPGWRESFSYMLGPSLLVAPVFVEGAVDRRVVLPPGEWQVLGTGEVKRGDAEAVLDAPLGVPVALLRLDSDERDQAGPVARSLVHAIGRFWV
ncbi:MAG TPA: TIM-barrel domain-containing protein, partial [Trueperaceae bacterium]|nr:TIM-barrel domain-containing protein [Trueperaceae bacterium]